MVVVTQGLPTKEYAPSRVHTLLFYTNQTGDRNRRRKIHECIFLRSFDKERKRLIKDLHAMAFIHPDESNLLNPRIRAV